MKKRLLSAILSFCMLLTMAPTVAFAADEDNEGNTAPAKSGTCGAEGSESSVTWKLTQNNEGNENPTYTLTISGNGAMADYAVGKAPWHVALSEAANRKQINQIELSSGLTHIGDNAFLQASVTDVKIPDTVISIGQTHSGIVIPFRQRFRPACRSLAQLLFMVHLLSTLTQTARIFAARKMAKSFTTRTRPHSIRCRRTALVILPFRARSRLSMTSR